MITRHEREALERSRLIRERLAAPVMATPVMATRMPRRGADTPLTNRSEILRLWGLGWTPKRIADAGWCSARHGMSTSCCRTMRW
jgi:hypothetical protein